jgi:hypothetical protein
VVSIVAFRQFARQYRRISLILIAQRTITARFVS